MNKIKEHIAIVAELSKAKITFFVAISGAVGYMMAGGALGLELILVSIGIFLLSSGSAAFNHYQESEYDALMRRTEKRPLPQKKISPRVAFIIASVLVLVGSIMIIAVANAMALLLGVLALIWYNIIYTPLKRKTSMAIMPGGVVGALPPAIGWAAAGGSMADPKIYALAAFFFIWQIPHFWFLMLIFDEDYRRAGYPTIKQKFSEMQIQRMTYAWIVALAASCMLLPLFGMINNTATSFLLFLAGFIIVYRTASLVRKYQEHRTLKFAFRDINIYVLTVVVILSIDKFI